MIIPNSDVKIRFSRPILYRAPVLALEVAGKNEPAQKIECIKAYSFAGFLKKNSPQDYTSLTLDSKGFFRSRKVKVLVKNKDLKKLIGRAEFQRLKVLNSSSDRFVHLKKCVGPLNPLDGRCKSRKGSSPSEWQTLSLQINHKLKALFPKLESDDIKKVRHAVNKMIVSKDASIFGLVDVKIEEKKEQIFLRKHKGKLFIDQPNACGKGGNATVYKVRDYALKKFNLATSIANAQTIDEDFSTQLKKQLKKEVEAEIEASNDIKNIRGTLKIKAPLKDMESDLLIGYVMKAYDGDFGDYLLSSDRNPAELCKYFTELARIFAQMHKKDKVHNDIKIDNVFTDFDQGGVKKLVVGDITKTDPDNLAFSMQYNFQSEIKAIKPDETLTIKDRLFLQKKLDVRQFAFFMYYSILAEKSDNPETEGKIKLNQAFPLKYPDAKITYPKDYSTCKERKANYNRIPENKAPEALRDLIERLLTEDFKTLPSMKEVYNRLRSIQSKAVNSSDSPLPDGRERPGGLKPVCA